MQHFSCDYCGKELSAHADARYSLRMEARLICEGAELDDADLDMQEPLDPVGAMEDWLAEAGESLDHSLDTGRPVAPLDESYDLCGRCYRRFRADPLGLDRASRLQFSDE